MSETILSWRDLPTQVLLDTTEFCDAYSIVGVEAFVELGVPSELVGRYERTHEGFVLGAGDQPVSEVRGVSCLSVLEAIHHDLGLGGSCFFGRQRQADQFKSQIGRYLMKTPS